MNTERTYTEKELIEFANYILDHQEVNKDGVTHASLENWKVDNQLSSMTVEEYFELEKNNTVPDSIRERLEQKFPEFFKGKKKLEIELCKDDIRFACIKSKIPEGINPVNHYLNKKFVDAGQGQDIYEMCFRWSGDEEWQIKDWSEVVDGTATWKY